MNTLRFTKGMAAAPHRHRRSMARNTIVPFKGRIQKRKTNHLHIVIFGLQRAAGPYRWARSGSHSAAARISSHASGVTA